jgi:hypothetical protein
MFSGTATEMMRLSSLSFQYSIPPLAKKVLAEIALLSDPYPPGRIAVVSAGKRATFTYDVRAEFGSVTTGGFDALRVVVPSQTIFQKLEMGVPLSPVLPDSVDLSDPLALTVYFPSNRIIPAQNHPLRVTFETSVLVYGTEFNGEIFDTRSREVPQPVEAGNASDNVGTNNINVIFSERSAGEILSSFTISPAVITPNGDRINDEAVISYTISQLIDDGTIDIRIYDLSSAPIRTFSSLRRGSGIYSVVWTGLDDDRRLVPPGIYLCEITIHTDSETFGRGKVISVAY